MNTRNMLVLETKLVSRIRVERDFILFCLMPVSAARQCLFLLHYCALKRVLPVYEIADLAGNCRIRYSDGACYPLEMKYRRIG